MAAAGRGVLSRMNPMNSIRRAALVATLAGAALGATPALSSASPCTYNPTTKTASVVDSSGINQLRVGVDGNLIFTKDGGNLPLNCVGGGAVATTTNTDRVNVFAQAKGASDGVVLDQLRGAFAPGATPETDGSSELELAVNGQAGHVSVFGTPGDDVMRVGADRSGASVMDLGPDLDQDVTITAASDISLGGGDGADVLSGQGFDDFAEARLPLGFSGGSGDDHIFGGLGVDHFSGNAGNDTLVTADGQAELVSGGPDTDGDVRDGGDTLSSVEVSVVGSGTLGRARLSSKTVRARAGRTANLAVSWTHPQSWRRLKMINLKAFDGDEPVGNVYIGVRGRVTGNGALGLASSRLTRHGRTARADLGLRLPRSLAGRTLRLDIEAADRDGRRQLVSGAGELRVGR
jgi:hemolysin type calcium-binding protein